MSFLSIVLVGVGLSMDAFAVSVCKGLRQSRNVVGLAIASGLFFGIAQAVMPIIGYFAGMLFAEIIRDFDHWVAFGLIFLVGAKMIHESFRNSEGGKCGVASKIHFGELFMLAIATSIDSLAVGVSFAFNRGVNIWSAVSIIGATTFAISFAGVAAGKKLGGAIGKRAGIFGGIVLIVLAFKILLSDLLA